MCNSSRFYFLLAFGVILLISEQVMAQKLTPCELKEMTVIDGQRLYNAAAGLVMELPQDFVPVDENVDASFTKSLYDERSFYVHSPKELTDNRSVSTIFHVQATTGVGAIYTNVFRNVLMSFGEDVYQDQFIQRYGQMEGFRVIPDGKGSLRQSYQDSKGLWWYFVEFESDSQPEAHSFVIFKNYNSHVLFLINAHGFSKESVAASDIIEFFEVEEWNDDLKLKKGKGDCKE